MTSEGSYGDREAVTAIVLTYDAPDSLALCLSAIAAQARGVDHVVVVDNDRDDRVDRIAARGGASVLHLGENAGPAGGWAAGLEEFLARGSTWAWLMDDDCLPAPDALERQLAVAESGASVVLATMADAASGAVANTQGWCAVLLHRDVVARVGVPRRELFWWTEDTEYLQWRIPRAGFAVRRADDALVRVARARADTEKPAWKYFYEARNQVYYRLHTQHVDDQPLPRHLRARVRTGRAARSVVKLAARAVARDREQRLRKLAMVMRGAYEGARGRLGRPVEPEGSHRPLVSGSPSP